jgi:hypothetical protein
VTRLGRGCAILAVAFVAVSFAPGAPATAQVEDGALPDVRTQEPQRFTLTSRAATIPITLVNEGETAVDVIVALSSDKLSFPAGDQIPLRLGPGLNSVDVDVEARTTGDSLVVVRVLSADGTTELDRTRLTVRSTALSGVGIAIAVVALAFLLTWWVRNHRDLRRDRRLVNRSEQRPPAEPDSTDTADDQR